MKRLFQSLSHVFSKESIAVFGAQTAIVEANYRQQPRLGSSSSIPRSLSSKEVLFSPHKKCTHTDLGYDSDTDKKIDEKSFTAMSSPK